YRYKLLGFDTEWHVQQTAAPHLFYPGLPPGDYTLLIKGENALGQATSNELHIPVFVHPYFWQTLWFRVFVIALSSLILLGMALLYLQSVRTKHKLLESQIATFRSQMNPHFFFNALNSIQDYIFNQEREKAADYMSGFAHLLRDTLNNSGKQYIYLTEEVDFLKRYLELESLRFEGLLNYEIRIAREIDREQVQIPSMLIQPLVENAIKHGLAPKKKDMRLSIHFYQKNNLIHCEVIDNGIGRKYDPIKKGHLPAGLNTVKQRIRLLSRRSHKALRIEIIDLVDETKQPMGTKVHLTFN